MKSAFTLFLPITIRMYFITSDIIKLAYSEWFPVMSNTSVG